MIEKWIISEISGRFLISAFAALTACMLFLVLLQNPLGPEAGISFPELPAAFLNPWTVGVIVTLLLLLGGLLISSLLIQFTRRLQNIGQLHARLQRKEQILALIENLQERQAKTPTPEDLFRPMLENLMSLSDCRFGFAGHIQQQSREGTALMKGGWLNRKNARQGITCIPQSNFLACLPEKLVDSVLLRGKALIWQENASDEEEETVWPSGWPVPKAVMSLPLKYDDRTIGMICLVNPKRSHAFQISLYQDLKPLLAVFAQILETSAREKKLLRREKDLLKNVAHLEEQATKLIQSNQALDDYAFVAAHDLQDPVRKIQMLGNILHRKAEGQMNAECHLYLSRMTFLSRKMQHMINDVLTLSRISKPTKTFRKIYFETLVPRVLRHIKPLLHESSAKIEFGPIPPLMIEPGLVSRLLENLIENALKFRNPDIAPVIRIYMNEPKNGWGELVVEDNGIGFEEKNAERIFRMFERLHGESDYPGQGIGLAICRKIAEQHGGTIRARGIPGKGARFIITLPLATPKNMIEDKFHEEKPPLQLVGS